MRSWAALLHGLARLEHPREPPSHGPGCGRRAEAHGQGPLGVHGRGLPLAAGEGGALPARAPRDGELLGRWLRAELGGAAGGPARDWAPVQVWNGCSGACWRGGSPVSYTHLTLPTICSV
eukprot:11602725-Alexandrium_andersonii.AAC.1